MDLSRVIELLDSEPDLQAYVATLSAERDTFEQAFDRAPIGMALVAPDGRLLRVNEALCEMGGWSAPELLAASWMAFTHADDVRADAAVKQGLLDGEVRSAVVEKRYWTKTGRILWCSVAISLVRDADGEPRHFISQITDISERKREEADLRHAADHDALTGLVNRRRFGHELERQVQRSRRHGESAAVVLLDLDHLKAVNDTHGHQAGDALLVSVAQALSARLRATDVLARLGGDEFAALLTHVVPEEALNVARALVRAVGDLGAETCTASAGVCAFAAGCGPSPELLERADRAMYAAKRAGRDGAVLA